MIFKILFSFFLFLFVDNTFAENAVGMIAVVDLKKVASQSKAGKSIEKQIASINDESKRDLLDLEAKIKSMDSDKKSNSDARKIEDMQLILYDMVRQKRYQITEAYKIAVSILDNEIKRAMKQICEKKDIKIVIVNDALAYMNDGFPDITAESTKLVDEKCPFIKVELKKENDGTAQG
jgi:Skp family chaperone for outer membrane proteins